MKGLYAIGMAVWKDASAIRSLGDHMVFNSWRLVFLFRSQVRANE